MKTNHILSLVILHFNITMLRDNYPNYVKWDIDKILVVTIDIEVVIENGFPQPENNRTFYFQSQLKIIKINRY